MEKSFKCLKVLIFFQRIIIFFLKQIKEIKDLHSFVTIFNEIHGKVSNLNKVLEFLWLNSLQKRLLKEYRIIKKRMPIQYNLL